MSKTKQKHFKQPIAPRVTFLTEKPFVSSLGIFLICLLFKGIDCFAIRTQESWLNASFVHLFAVLAVLYLVLRKAALSLEEIGLDPEDVSGSLRGLLGGLFAYVIAFTMEMALTNAQGKSPKFALYLGNAEHNGIQWLLLGLVLCALTALAEEGLFRGVILRTLKEKMGFNGANVLTSAFYILWAIIPTVQKYASGKITVGAFISTGIFFAILAFTMSAKWGMLAELKGNVWTAVGDHFFTDFIGCQILHVVTDTGTDEFFALRLLCAQVISFSITLSEFRHPSGTGKKKRR